ncbi:MAG: DUF6470 family protein [Oscillospiraceae bacterium]|nr:DUF6470 family protein [Oscillospiraceae bacterium]
MAIYRLNIDQQLAEIGVRTTPAKLNISMPKGQMTINTERPQMQIDKKAPTFKLNRQKLNNETGLKGPLELAKTFRNKGKQTALRAAGAAKNDGNFLANHKVKGDKVPRLAKNKTMERLGPKEFNVGLMPESSPPEITWDKGYMRINWSKHSIVIDYTGEYMPDMTVDPRYSVEVFLRTEPYFRVMVEEAVSSTGRYVDHAV